MTRVVLHIDKLILRGIDPADAAAISASVQSKLQHLLSEPGAAAPFTEGGHRHRINAGTVNVAAAAGSQAMGHAIADRIIKGRLNQ